MYYLNTSKYISNSHHNMVAASQIELVKGGPGSYRLRMNESEIEAEIHTLRDGGLLMQVIAVLLIY